MAARRLVSEARARVCLRAALLRRTRVLHGECWRKEEAERKKGEREIVERVPPGGGGCLPDAEVCAAGVVAADGGDSAGVRSYVPRPGLGDVEGAVRIQSHAWDGLNADHRALFLPDVPRTQKISVSIFSFKAPCCFHFCPFSLCLNALSL